MELENIILASQVQKAKGHMFFSYVKYKQYFEKQVTLREGH
jgi:hypothetical protein